jgi:hypothetical protein
MHYGDFFQFVAPLEEGHVSVCFEPDADVASVVTRLRSVLRQPISR